MNLDDSIPNVLVLIRFRDTVLDLEVAFGVFSQFERAKKLLNIL